MATKKSTIFILILFLVTSFIFVHTIFYKINNLGVGDWDANFGKLEILKKILGYKQIPLWNPYMYGGTPFLANPILGDTYFSLTLILVQIFGAVIGIKISIFIHLLLGMFGMYLLCRHYNLKKIISLLPSFIFMLSGFYVSHLTTGHTWVLIIAIIPYVFLFYLKSMQDKKNIIFASIFLALMLLIGAHIFLYTSLFLIIYSIFKVIEMSEIQRISEHAQKSLIFDRKKIFTVKILLTIFIVAVLLSSIKLIPNIDFLSKQPRYTKYDYSGYSLNTLYHGLLDRDQGYFIKRDLGPFYNGAIGEKGQQPFITGISHGWDENGAYTGLIPLALFLIGIPLLWKKHWPLILTSLTFLWLSFGHRAPISLWKFFQLFPIWDMVSSASRSIIIFIFCLAIINGLTLQRLYQLFHKKLRYKRTMKFITFLIVCFITFDLIIVNGTVLKDAFVIPSLNVTPHKEFYQTSRHYKYSNLTGMYDYPNFLRNEGKVNAYIEIPTKVYAVSKESEDYKGEAYLQGTQGEVSYTYWSPNKLIVDVNASGEGYVVINQNYAKGWKTKNNRKVESFNGLISTKVYPEDKQVTFYYLPWSFVVGLIISLLSIIGIIPWWWKLKNYNKCN